MIASPEMMRAAEEEGPRPITESHEKAQYIALLFVLMWPLTFWKGYLVSIMWRWFLVPLGVPAVGAWHVIGIALVVSVMTKPQPFKSGEPLYWKTITDLVFAAVLAWPLLFGLAALIRWAAGL